MGNGNRNGQLELLLSVAWEIYSSSRRVLSAPVFRSGPPATVKRGSTVSASLTNDCETWRVARRRKPWQGANERSLEKGKGGRLAYHQSPRLDDGVWQINGNPSGAESRARIAN